MSAAVLSCTIGWYSSIFCCVPLRISSLESCVSFLSLCASSLMSSDLVAIFCTLERVYKCALGIIFYPLDSGGDFPKMGFNTFDNDNDDSGGYALFDNGDNAIAKPSKIAVDSSTYRGDRTFEIRVEFEAVEELDEEKRGTIPYWPNSKITVKEDSDWASDLAKLLQAAGVVEDVLEELGAPEDKIEEIMNGEGNFQAESEEENQELCKAVAKHLPGSVLRVSTVHNSSDDPDYSKVEKVYGLKDGKKDLFESFKVDIELEHDSDEDEGSENDSVDDRAETENSDDENQSEDAGDGDDEKEAVFVDEEG